jgi:hypothetical protein
MPTGTASPLQTVCYEASFVLDVAALCRSAQEQVGIGRLPEALAAPVAAGLPQLAARRHRYTQRRVVAFTLFAPVRDMLFFFAKAIHGPAE